MKQITCIALAFVIALSTSALPVGAETTAIVGDVNRDGNIDSLDASQILKHDAGLITFNADTAALGDVNQNGQTDSLDASQVLKYDAAIITMFCTTHQYITTCTEGTYCTNCHHVKTSAQGHRFLNGACTVCGYTVTAKQAYTNLVEHIQKYGTKSSNNYTLNVSVANNAVWDSAQKLILAYNTSTQKVTIGIEIDNGSSHELIALQYSPQLILLPAMHTTLNTGHPKVIEFSVDKNNLTNYSSIKFSDISAPGGNKLELQQAEYLAIKNLLAIANNYLDAQNVCQITDLGLKTN